MTLFQPQAGNHPNVPAITVPRLYWLAERAAPVSDPHGVTCDCCPRGAVTPTQDVFVTMGDSVVLSSGETGDTTAVIVGADGTFPVVRYTTGSLTGRCQTVDPDDIVAAILLKRMGLW